MKRHVDPFDPKNHGRPLWVVYGPKCFPSVLCCQVNAGTVDTLGQREPCIWGFSVYRGEPGFRTLGIELSDWIRREKKGPGFPTPRFYLRFRDAMRRVRKCGPKGAS